MADIIQLLPDAVANQIAAGEVVQRPASVIKELVENALDSGASKITIHVKDAGRTLIQVIDNGCGMTETDARLAFERHATSKIRQAVDLFNIRTMGFRGEALASISAVAQVELKTKTHDSDLGTHVVINGSKLEKQEMSTCESGSQFIVKNLFYNIPARRKFLKKDSIEFSHILNEIHRVAIVNPEIHFVLMQDDKEVYNLPKGNLKQRIQNIFGKNLSKDLVPIFSESPLIKITGFIGKPERATKKGGEQFFFANGRFMKHPYFFKTVLNTYADVLSSDMIPRFFILLEVDPQDIDINIHPTKTEIKFENEPALAQIIAATVREAIGKFNFSSSMNFEAEDLPMSSLNLSKNEISIPSIHINPEYNPFEEKRFSTPREQYSNNKTSTTDHQAWLKMMADISHSEPRQHQIFDSPKSANEQEVSVMQFALKFIVATTDKALMIIHQRRAHHRILYERYLQRFQNKKLESQALVFPIEKEISEDYRLMVEELMSELNAIGYQIVLENQQMSIQSLPAEMKQAQAVEAIDQMIQDFSQFNANVEYERQKFVAKMVAYRASVGYQKLNTSEMQTLVNDLFLTTEPAYCPRGKRIFTMMNQAEIERQLKI
ncbi:MAG: DNA mismatch repair endonuclease MutL [Bacteroidales bacterium]|nr:DNA mismatch repair endonuclease MutL [Bacteroidales bacterium]